MTLIKFLRSWVKIIALRASRYSDKLFIARWRPGGAPVRRAEMLALPDGKIPERGVGGFVVVYGVAAGRNEVEFALARTKQIAGGAQTPQWGWRVEIDLAATGCSRLWNGPVARGKSRCGLIKVDLEQQTRARTCVERKNGKEEA